MIARLPSSPGATLVVLGGLLAGLLAILGAQTSPLYSVVALVVLAVMALAVFRPLAAIYLAVLLIPLETLSVGVGGAFGLSPTEFVALAAAAGWTLHRLTSGGASLRSPLTLPIALLLIAHIPGLFLAVNPFAVVKEIVMWTAFYILFLAVISDRGSRTAETMTTVIAAAAAVVAAVAVERTAGSQQALVDFSGNVTDRATGSLGAPTLLAIFLAAALPLQAVLMLRGTTRVHRIGGVVALLLTLAALALAMTRSAFVAVGIVALWLMVVWPPFRRVAAVFAVVGLLVASGINPSSGLVNTTVLVQRISSITSTQSTSAKLRVQLWQGVPALIKDHLMFGVGADNFVAAAPRYGLMDPTGAAYPHAHNIVLTIAAEFGLPGLAALLWIAVALAVTLARGLRVRGDPAHALAVGLTAAFLAVVFDGIFDYAFSDNAFFLLVILLAACATRLACIERPAPA